MVILSFNFTTFEQKNKLLFVLKRVPTKINKTKSLLSIDREDKLIG